MEKRFQVFVSSTFRDLREERREIMQALLEMDCIPAGMELFPAADDDAWTLIKRVIGQSDYYMLVVGGRYGSMDADGLSYTEREYDHAVAQGLTILAFLHADPGKIAAENTDLEPALREKLAAFRKRSRPHTIANTGQARRTSAARPRGRWCRRSSRSPPQAGCAPTRLEAQRR